jgi:hypothetical protein
MRKFFFFLVVSCWSLNALAQEETNVLFIGNSFTFMNNMPFIFKDIATSKGRNVHVDTVVEGGKNLEYHSNQLETYQAINSRKWDYVVVQAHSNELAQPDTKVDKNTFPFAQKIIDSIRKNSPCTQVILYMTWGYKYGNPKWAPIASYDSMQYRISNQYLRFADLLNTQVSPVGEVWKHVRANHAGINLYDPDNFHPNLEGSYISACTFYAAIFGESPYQNSAPVAIKQDVRQIIELTASFVVLNNLSKWRYVPNRIRPIPSFDIYQNGNEVQFYNTSTHANQVSWNFGDGTTSTEVHPIKKFEQVGTYTIELVARNACNAKTQKRTLVVK